MWHWASESPTGTEIVPVAMVVKKLRHKLGTTEQCLLQRNINRTHSSVVPSTGEDVL